jgi:[acyl-carrier-protein] S-malonyltransferase
MQGVALVFPGQGSQQPAMAAAWRDHPAFARWAEAGDLLGWDVARLGVEAPADELREPRKCQVALFTHQAVLLEAWHAAGGAEPVAVAGHSLGEYNALLAAGVLGFGEGLRLVDARARLTGEAARQRPGRMVACLGFDVDDVTAAAADAGAHVANDNAPGQVVVSGTEEALDRLAGALAGGPGRGKVVRLEVGAAYHSPHMEPALEPFDEALAAAPFADAAVPVVANVDAAPHTGAAEWPELLRRQVTSPVRWRETVTALPGLAVTDVVELGASPVLTGLVKRIDRDLGRRNISTPEDLEELRSVGSP